MQKISQDFSENRQIRWVLFLSKLKGRRRPEHSGRAKPAAKPNVEEKERGCKMVKSKKSELQNYTNAITKPNSEEL